jgi:hypothetical protein
MPDDAIPGPQPAPAPPQTQPSWLIRAARWLAQEIGTLRFWSTALFALSAAYILIVVQPFAGPPAAATADDVSRQWNDSIARLGIMAVYPMQEDFQVGDVLALVGATSGEPILGKSVRIDHIDLRPYIVSNDEDRPVFADTKEPKANQSVRDDARLEVGPRPEADKIKIATAIAAFPAITINHSAKSSIAAALAEFGISGSRAIQQFEQINLLQVESYSAPAPDAKYLFEKWCADNPLYCKDDAWARQMLAAAVTPQVLSIDKKTGLYDSQIELRLVTRVFMTRQIDTRRWVVDSSGTALEIPSPGKAAVPTVPAAAPATVGPDGKSPASGSGAVAPAPEAGPGKFAAQWSNESEIGLKGTFQRPVVFGIRSIRNVLKTAPPPAPAAANPADTTARK